MLALRWRPNDHDGVSNHQLPHCLLNCLFGRRSKKTSKLRVTGLCAGNSPGTGKLPAQMASDAENVSIWWRHHGEFEYHQGIPSALGIGMWSWNSDLETYIKDAHLEHFLWNATKPDWWLVNFGSGSGLVPSSNKPLHRPMLIKF